MRPTLPLLLSALLVAGCRGRPAPEEPGPAESNARPLNVLAAQQVLVTPAYALAVADPLHWGLAPRGRELLRTLDSAIAGALGERGLARQWLYPADLARAQRASPTYAADPYALGVGPLRNPNLVAGSKVGEPLGSQLRTMIALTDARAVLIPVELRFEPAPDGKGVAALRIAVVDGRLAELRWIGTVRSDPAVAFSPGVLESLAVHLADLIAAP